MAVPAGMTVALAAALPLQAAVVYTDEASFLLAIQNSPVSLTGFEDDTDGGFTPPANTGPDISINESGFSFTIDVVGGGDVLVQLPEGDLTSNVRAFDANKSLIITFSGGSPTAVGGNFFTTDIDNLYENASFTLTLNDGSTTVQNVTSDNSQPPAFVGFTTTSPIQSLTISASGPGLYSALDNLTVGYAVPEPAEMATAVAAALLGGAWWLRRRNQRRAA